jgi:hypothetical protein
MTSILLDDGNRTLELMGSGPLGIWTALNGWNPPVVARENTYADSPDSVGKRRIRSKPQNPEGTWKGNIGHTVAATFWDFVDNLQDMIAAVHENKGTITYTAPQGATAITYDIQSIELTELPQDGVQLNQLLGEASFKFECLPFGRLAPITIWTGKTFSGPIDYEDVASVTGHLPALAELTLTDASSQTRGHVEVAVQEDYNPASPEPLLLNLASGLTVAGYGGSSTTRSGSYSANVARATLTAAPTTICATSAQAHKGRWKVRCRVYPSTSDIRARLAWKVGDGPVSRERWVTVPGNGDFFDLDLETIEIEALPVGHSWTGYIEAYATAGTPTLDVDFLDLLPGANYGRARAPLKYQTPLGLAAADEFGQTSGNLAGKTLRVGGTWGGAGDVSDYQLLGGPNFYAFRNEINDVVSLGRFATAGTATYSSVLAGVDFLWDTAGQALPTGVVSALNLRYSSTGTNGYVAVGVQSLTGKMVPYIDMKSVLLGPIGDAMSVSLLAWYSLIVLALSNGGLAVWIFPRGGSVPAKPTVVMQSSHLAAGGSHASGIAGIYDENASAGTCVRYYDNFWVATPNVDVAINSGQSARFLDDIALRENAAGTSEGKVPVFEGRHLTFPPATRAGLKSRVIVKSRRLDVDGGLPDAGLSDNLTGDLNVTPRVLLLQ